MTRAKFTCVEVAKSKHWRGDPGEYLYAAKFRAVTGEGAPENESFWAATPSGEITLSTVRADHFEVGEDYYVDFTQAENA